MLKKKSLKKDDIVSVKLNKENPKLPKKRVVSLSTDGSKEQGEDELDT